MCARLSLVVGAVAMPCFRRACPSSRVCNISEPEAVANADWASSGYDTQAYYSPGYDDTGGAYNSGTEGYYGGYDATAADPAAAATAATWDQQAAWNWTDIEPGSDYDGTPTAAAVTAAGDGDYTSQGIVPYSGGGGGDAHDWSQETDSYGNTYWYNHVTGSERAFLCLVLALLMVCVAVRRLWS
jgi:hypothetical protein